MFCSKCGTQIDDSASFCFRCGSPVVQGARTANTYQQPTGQQSPAYGNTDYYNNHLEKFGVNIVYPDGRRNEIGDLYITTSELIFVKKSKGVRIAFGLLGSALEQGEEKLRFSFADIVGGQRTKIGINLNVYQITLRNGESYKICVNNPGKIACLAQRFG